MLESVSLLVDVLAELTLPDVSVEGVVELVLVLLGVVVVDTAADGVVDDAELVTTEAVRMTGAAGLAAIGLHVLEIPLTLNA